MKFKDMTELEKGIEIEKEHLETYSYIKDYYKKNNKFPPDREFAEMIAKDHLKEMKDYYTKLIKMEKE